MVAYHGHINIVGGSCSLGDLLRRGPKHQHSGIQGPLEALSHQAQEPLGFPKNYNFTLITSHYK